jgi:hypothetical protein
VYLLRSATLALVLLAGAAGPAAAEDCFIRVKVGETPRAAPPHRPRARHPAAAVRPRVLHRVHRLVAHPHRKRTQALAGAAPTGPRYVESSIAQASVPVYELRPISCDSRPGIRSKAPGLTPLASQRLLDALVTPAPAPAPPAPAPVETGPVIVVPDTVLPGLPPGPAPVGDIGGPPPQTPGTPPGAPPLTPPIGGPGAPPPVITPPGGPPGTPPGTPPVVTPPVVTPPDTPPGTPPGIPPGTPPDSPPDTPITPLTPPLPPPLTPPGAPVPEPAAWAMLLTGFFAVGAALRRRRSRAAATFE